LVAELKGWPRAARRAPRAFFGVAGRFVRGFVFDTTHFFHSRMKKWDPTAAGTRRGEALS